MDKATEKFQELTKAYINAHKELQELKKHLAEVSIDRAKSFFSTCMDGLNSGRWPKMSEFITKREKVKVFGNDYHSLVLWIEMPHFSVDLDFGFAAQDPFDEDDDDEKKNHSLEEIKDSFCSGISFEPDGELDDNDKEAIIHKLETVLAPFAKCEPNDVCFQGIYELTESFEKYLAILDALEKDFF